MCITFAMKVLVQEKSAFGPLRQTMYGAVPPSSVSRVVVLRRNMDVQSPKQPPRVLPQFLVATLISRANVLLPFTNERFHVLHKLLGGDATGGWRRFLPLQAEAPEAGIGQTPGPVGHGPGVHDKQGQGRPAETLSRSAGTRAYPTHDMAAAKA